MPPWSGRWKGGRYYLDAEGKPVYFIERMRRSVKLLTHDEQIAEGQLGLFLADPLNFSVRPAGPAARPDAVFITDERLALYMESIRKTVKDHRTARAKYLADWSDLGIDLRAVDRKGLRAALTTFDGGHRGRVEALNAFARFLVREEDLPSWNPLVNTRDSDPELARAARQAYTLAELDAAWNRLTPGPMRDVFLLRAATGMHQTEIDQLVGAKVGKGPLPDVDGKAKAVIRDLGEGHEIRGVLQVWHKSSKRHRVSLTANALAAALRLTEGVPSRVGVWKALAPIVPSNLRHTNATLGAERSRTVTWAEGGGASRAAIAAQLGHRAGSTMLSDHYDKLQIPPMIVLPLVWG